MQNTSDLLNALQWPAMLITIIAAWLVASSDETKRRWGFYGYFVSNVLWIAWGYHTHAWALITLQVALFAMNCRGAAKNSD